VFERFTDRARRVLVLAQEEARLLNHSFIGTEHILLGLIHEGDGVAARALAQMEISLEAARELVEETIGLSGTVPVGSPPFTPRAKKVLELSLREALQLGHNYIGTEHMLLGLVREGEGVAAQVLVGLGADLPGVRQTVIQLLPGAAGSAAASAEEHGDLLSRRRMSRSGRGAGSRIIACSFCGRRPPDTGQLISGSDAFICEHCVAQWSERLAADEPRQVVHSQVWDSGTLEITGPPPGDLDAARAEIADAFSSMGTASEDGLSVPSVEGGTGLGSTLRQARERPRPQPQGAEASIGVVDVVFLDAEHAAVWFDIAFEGTPDVQGVRHRRGDAVVVDGIWRVARSTFCELMRLAGVECPPASDE
jgi:hypothetical protein